MQAEQDILATLSYFDLFDYPVTQTEIFQFAQNTYTYEELSDGLHQLLASSWVYRLDDFYSLRNDHRLVARRRAGNARARDMMKTADRIASFLSAFPFVRGVAVSGSLSKNFADEGSDIDFFIITAENKLWLARSFMHLFKKLTFLLKKQDWFCMNYYIDESALQIREKNTYTATEVVTLIPLRGIDAFQKFQARNKWSRHFLPNHTMKVSYVQAVKKPWVKQCIEIMLRNPLGNLADHLLMRLTAKRWAGKTARNRRNSRGIVMSMDAGRHYAKPDPGQFQQQLLHRYEEKIFHLFRRYQNKVKTRYEP